MNMEDVIDVTPGLQCCLICGRTLTNRLLHDQLEELIIKTIRSEHPEWASADEACAPRVSAYRELLDGRLKRAAKLNAELVERGWRARISRFLNPGDVAGTELLRRIRIIKRDLPPEAVTPLAENPTDAERGDAAATVMRWVDEMRERKGVETKAGFDNLFRKAASRASSERASRAVNISLEGVANNNESNQIP